MRQKKEVFITNNFEETQKLGEKFAQGIILREGLSLKKGKAIVVALYGDLGAGKTTFVQGFAKGLGIKKRIISPTFTIVRQYKSILKTYSSSELDNSSESRSNNFRQARTIIFYHIDLYRVESVSDMRGLGIEEILEDKNNIVVIEWAEKLGNLLPENRIDINFEYLGDEKRRIFIQFKVQNAKFKITV